MLSVTDFVAHSSGARSGKLPSWRRPDGAEDPEFKASCAGARAACRRAAVASPRHRAPGSREAQAPEPESLSADEPVQDFSFIGLFNGAPDLSERSEEILRAEFAKRADADH